MLSFDWPDEEHVKRLYELLCDGFLPEPDLLVWEWAEKHRELRGVGAAEPGPWDTSRTPYLRKIMECLSPRSPYQQVVFQKGGQVGGSECGNNWLGFCIAHSPGPFLYVLPTSDTAKRVSRQRIEPLLEGTPAIRDKVSAPRSRDGSNSVFIKEFTGGILILTGANSAVGLRQMSCRYMMFDEIDGYPVDIAGEGDPIELAWVRARTFGARRKALIVSTPTLAGISRIERRFEDTDKQYYHCPCPKCGKKFTFDFDRLKWLPGQPETARMICPNCEHPCRDSDKTKMLRDGEWIATGVSKDAHVVGFHLSSLYSPVGWFSWEEAARQWERATTEEDKITYTNTVLGKTWSQNLKAPDAEIIYNRREDHTPGILPHGVYFLTAGVDVQGDRLEVFVWGWGPKAECWLIEHAQIDGEGVRAHAWRRLDGYMEKKWTNTAGLELSLEYMAVDTGAYTDEVYAWGSGWRHDPRVMLVKGDHKQGVVLGIPAKKDVTKSGKMKKYGVKVWPVGVDLAKTSFYRRLKLPTPDFEDNPDAAYEPGFVHILKNVGRGICRQLCSEDLVTIKDRKTNRPKRAWALRGTERNEALDGWVYAYAAACRWGMWQMSAEDWLERGTELGVIGAAPEREAETEPAPKRRGWVPKNRVLGGV